jgi:hypothetical protein
MMTRKGFTAIFIFFCLIFLIGSSSTAFSNEKKYSSSSSCKACHDQIYWGWAASMHSKSVSKSNILFRKAFEFALEETDGTVREQCLSCHAPIAVELGDLKLKRDISKEGINCDYCHTLIPKLEKDTFTLISSPGKTKYGPYEDCKTEAHESKYSEVYTKSEFCFKCHATQKNPHGLELCSTAPEWEGSIHAVKKKQCQDCHMPTVTGTGGKGGPEREEVSLHNFYGGHDAGALNSAAKLELKMSEEESVKRLTVTVSNIGAGHSLPTSFPLRSIALKLFAYDSNGKELWTNWKNDPFLEDRQALFAKILTDNSGKPVLPLKATKVALDSRLASEETRELPYDFPADLDIAKVTANLQYKLAPDSILEELKIYDDKLRSWHTMTRAELSLKQEERGTKDAPTASIVRKINVYAEQWKFTPNVIKIKQGERIKLVLRTLDDTHSFRVKKLGINVKIFPGKKTEVEIEGKEKGKYRIDSPGGDRAFKMKGYIIVE